MAEPSSVIVNVGDLEANDVLLSSTGTGPTTLKPDEDNAIRLALAEVWRSKAFADVEIVCGVDGVTIFAHRIVLGSLSSFLRLALRADHAHCQHETSCLMLPDVDSVVLSNFLAKIYQGSNELAVTNPSLEYLGFQHRPFQPNIKREFDEAADYMDSQWSGDSFDDDFYWEDNGPETVSKKGGAAWKYFDRIDSAVAKCSLCTSIVGTGKGSTIGMIRHLRKFHPEVYSTHGMSFQSGRDRSFETSSKNLKKRSPVWNYFVKQEGKSAMCTLCRSVIRTESSNTSGMGRHLKRYHPEVNFESFFDSSGFGNDSFEWPIDPSSVEVQFEEASYESNFDQKAAMNMRVWNYFERQQDNCSAACHNCQAMVSTEGGSTSDMIFHLQKYHPDIWSSFEQPAVVKSEMEDIFSYEDDAIKGRLRSLVWNYYVREDKTTALCSICNATVKTGMGNTSGMARHLRRSHPEEYSQFKEATKMIMPEAKPRAEKPLMRRKVNIRSLVEEDPMRDLWQFFENVQGGEGEPQNGTSECTAVCKFCQSVFAFNSEDTEPLEMHLREMHHENLEEYKERIKQEAADISLRKHHRSAIWNFFRKTEDKTKNECMECGKIMLCSSQNTTSMIRHLERRHHELFIRFLKESGSKEETIKKATEKKLLKNLKLEDANDPSNRTCPVCLKVYWHKRAMLYHKKVVHSGERPYKCQECSMTFARLDCFQKHSHTNERKFLCSLCGKTFGRKSARDLHERAHRGDRRYSCSHCAKMFMTNQALTKHERIHTGEKPYQCKECGRQFTQQHQLTTHIRIHTGEKPYSCDFCDLKFRHLSSKSKHKCEGRLMAVKWMNNPVLIGQEHPPHHDSD